MADVSKAPHGTDDAAICPKCGGGMYVARRARYPVIIQGEKQFLICRDCDEIKLRSVDSDGHQLQ